MSGKKVAIERGTSPYADLENIILKIAKENGIDDVESCIVEITADSGIVRFKLSQYHALDFLATQLIKNIREFSAHSDPTVQKILGYVINWIKNDLIGQVMSFYDFERKLKNINQSFFSGASGTEKLIEDLLPTEFYNLPMSQREETLYEAVGIYNEALNKLTAFLVDNPSLLNNTTPTYDMPPEQKPATAPATALPALPVDWWPKEEEINNMGK